MITIKEFKIDNKKFYNLIYVEHKTDKYRKLLNFFLDLRNVKKGGVDGFHTPFMFSISYLQAKYRINKKELIEMMTLLKEIPLILFDEGKNELYEEFIIKDDTMTVTDCTTQRIKMCKLFLDIDTIIEQL